MYKQQSLSRISSRSLSKIKTKIEMAFAKPVNNENKLKKQTNSIPVRSKSTKSLSKYKQQVPNNNIPFAIALKTGLVSSSRKQSVHQTPTKESRNRFSEEMAIKRKIGQEQKCQNKIICQRIIKNQSISGYSWYHEKGKQLISVCKKNQGKMLRYFAVKEEKETKTVKKVLAALEGTFSSTQYVICGKQEIYADKINKQGLNQQIINFESCSDLERLYFDPGYIFQDIDQSFQSFCNVSKLISDIYAMISDGLTNMDTIANILGRKIGQLRIKKEENKVVDVFVLIVLVDKDRNQEKKPQLDRQNFHRLN